MKNITITLPEPVARWARIHAAEREVSVSRMVSDLLEEKMKSADEFDAAMSSFQARKPRKLRKTGEPLPSRESLYER